MAEKKVNGETYRVNPVPAKRALILFAKIGKVIGPGLPEFVAALASREDEQASNAAAASSIAQIMVDVEPEAFADLVEEVLEIAEVEHQGQYLPVSFERFNNRLSDVVGVLAFVLREQFGDFFSGLLVSGTAARKAHSQNKKSGE